MLPAHPIDAGGMAARRLWLSEEDTNHCGRQRLEDGEPTHVGLHRSRLGLGRLGGGRVQHVSSYLC